MPWSRSNERFIRNWLVVTGIPIPEGSTGFEKDVLTDQGGETAIHQVEHMTHHLPNGESVSWQSLRSWGDDIYLTAGDPQRNLVGYAFATVPREISGKALLTVGSTHSIRVWVNGVQVLDRRASRALTRDEDKVEVDLQAGNNFLLVKLEQGRDPVAFAIRVLEPGATLAKSQEIGPSLISYSNTAVALRTDVNSDAAKEDKVTVQIVSPGGKVVVTRSAPRGNVVHFEVGNLTDGPYDFRLTTRRANALLYSTHIPWYKGDSMRAARDLVAAGANANLETANGLVTAMLADRVKQQLGQDIDAVKGNPWWLVHSPLMEYKEIELEAHGEKAIERPFGFVRLAYRDEIDGTPQFCSAYLPGGYDRSKKWPIVVTLHGWMWSPAYVQSGEFSRHGDSDAEYSGGQGVIFLEPFGRGVTNYIGLGDQDVMRCIRLAKERLSVDEDRVYLTGVSMGG